MAVPQLTPFLPGRDFVLIDVFISHRCCERAFYFSSGHGLDLLELGPLKTKEGCHLDDLVFIYEIFWIGAELFDSRFEVAATHSLWNFEANSALPAQRIMQAEFTNDHLASCHSLKYTKSAELISSSGSAKIQLLTSGNL